MRIAAALALAVLGVTGAVLAAVAGGGAGDASAAPRNVVSVEITDRAIDAGSAPVRAGRVTFEEVNRGTVDHDLLLVRTDRDPDDLPLGLEGPAPELAGEIVFGERHSDHAHDGRGKAGYHHISPGERRDRTVTLTPGSYVLICPVPGHYGAGQRTGFTVR